MGRLEKWALGLDYWRGKSLSAPTSWPGELRPGTLPLSFGFFCKLRMIMVPVKREVTLDTLQWHMVSAQQVSVIIIGVPCIFLLLSTPPP